VLLALLAAGTMVTSRAPQAAEPEWKPLFNGRDLAGWTPKIRGEKLGDNYANTFRVEEGVLKVGYDPQKYPQFGEKFGHLFYNQKFSHYRLRVEYRFTGNQCPGGPGWAFRNSGVMVHGEDPALRSTRTFPPRSRCNCWEAPARETAPPPTSALPGPTW
jgi:hypothetical protein